jgi:hypothetical protein
MIVANNLASDALFLRGAALLLLQRVMLLAGEAHFLPN